LLPASHKYFSQISLGGRAQNTKLLRINFGGTGASLSDIPHPVLSVPPQAGDLLRRKLGQTLYHQKIHYLKKGERSSVDIDPKSKFAKSPE
jgi:hypothetical protein